MPPQKIHMTINELRLLVNRVLRSHGLNGGALELVSNTIVAGEVDTGGSHGLFRILMCTATLRAGLVNLNAKPKLRRVTSSIVMVDSDDSFAPVAFAAGKDVLIEAAREHGIALLGLRNCFNFGPLWPEVEALARAGLAGMAYTSSHSWVAPEGGNAPLFGTNPMAFSWPRPGKDPYVFDFATSQVARGEIELACRSGRQADADWGIDSAGRPTLNPQAILDGSMRTFGGYKGSAIATMVELLSGPLIADLTSRSSKKFDDGRQLAPYGGELIIAIDPCKTMGTDFHRHFDAAEGIFEAIAAQGARIPSMRRYEARRKKGAEGVHIDRNTYEAAMALLEDV